MVCFVPSVCLSIRKSCQRRDCSELGTVRNWVDHCINKNDVVKRMQRSSIPVVLVNEATVVGYKSCIVVVVVLLFYVHGKHLRSCRDGQLS